MKPILAAPGKSNPNQSHSKLPIRSEPSSQDVLSTPAKVEPALSVKSLANSLRRQTEIQAFDDFTAPTCEEAERASQIRACAEPQLQPQDDLSRSIGTLFNHLRKKDRSFQEDMDIVEKLLEQATELQALDSSDAHQAALIAQQKRHIYEEIRRIDDAHQEANLLKLIPAAQKIVKSLNAINPD